MEEIAMLVLSRKLGQVFSVGDDIHITIVKIDRHSVRIGIEAPGDVTIYREEIVRLDEQAEASATPAPLQTNAA
jgi:carbon storage regulator